MVMPAGISSVGEKIPKMPGSSVHAVSRTGIDASIGRGDEVLTIAVSQSHWNMRKQSRAKEPSNQMESRIASVFGRFWTLYYMGYAELRRGDE